MLLGNLGSVLAGAPLSALAAAVGWRGVFVGVGFVSLGLALSCWLLVRDRHDGAMVGRIDRTAILGGLTRVLANRATWPAVAVNFGLAGSFFAFGGLWATPYLVDVRGWSRAVASTPFNIGGLLGGALLQPLIGWAMDQSWSGTLADGVRLYTVDDYRWRLALPAAAALFGALSAWRLRETHCHNIHQQLQRPRPQESQR